MAFLGFPLMKYIDVNDSEEVRGHHSPTQRPHRPIIHTPVGWCWPLPRSPTPQATSRSHRLRPTTPCRAGP
jgi:hypothetical protein